MNAPDRDLVRGIAADLAVDPAFVEKDWAAVQVIAAIAEVKIDGFRPVFSGGTCLSKAYGLIQRFSEDVDFKALLPEAVPSRNAARKMRSAYRESVIAALVSRGWRIVEDSIQVGNDSQYFAFHVAYDFSVDPPLSLRPQVQVEMTLRPPALPYGERSVQSFVSSARGEAPEVSAVACVSPVETAADKLSALVWRILNDANDADRRDRNLVRHLHDLAALKSLVRGQAPFRELALDLLDSDAARIQDAPEWSECSSKSRLIHALEILETNDIYRDDYERFVLALSYARDDERIGYNEALEALRGLPTQFFAECRRLRPRTLSFFESFARVPL